jgi:hypothetical protein
MSKHDDGFRGFSVLSEAWYGKYTLARNDDVSEEIMLGIYHPEGGTTGEFAIRWMKVGERFTPRLEVFHDAWDAMWRFADVLEGLASMDGQRPKPDRVTHLLRTLGIKDRTDRSDVQMPPPLCKCCRQPLPAADLAPASQKGKDCE